MSINEMIPREVSSLSCGQIANPLGHLRDESKPEGARQFNFDPHTPEGEELLFLSEEGATRDVTQHFERPFLMKWWSAKSVDLPDLKTGDPTRCVRLTLISPERETLTFTSQGAIHSLDLIRTLRGDGPYEPALPIVVKQEETRSGFRMYRLRLATSQQ